MSGSDDDYIFIGYGIDGHTASWSTPLIVPKTMTWISSQGKLFSILARSHGENGLESILANSGLHSCSFVISQLYKLPNLRNVDILSLCKTYGCYLLDNNNTTIVLPLNGTNDPIDGQPLRGTPEQQIEKWKQVFKPQIMEIEKKYPGLFKPVFLSQEETQEAVNAVIQKPGRMGNEEVEERIGNRLDDVASQLAQALHSAIYSANDELQTTLRSQIRQLQEDITNLKQQR
jgi:polyhydroxyalkanoate synthesis regulator phasin